MYKKSEKRKLQAMKTRENIFHSATALFEKKGFDNVTIEEITSGAGISTGTFYLHFKSKEALIFEWVNQLDEIYQNFYDEEVIHAVPDNLFFLLKKKFLLVLNNYTQWGREVVAISYSYMMRDEELRERMTNSNRICNQISRELFTRGQEWGLIRTDFSVQDLIKGSVKAERGALIDWCVQGGTTEIQKESEAFIQLYLDSIAAKN